MSHEVLGIIEQLCREKGIDREIMINALKSAMEAAARKKLETDCPLQTEFNPKTGEVEIFSEKTVVDKVTNPENEITLENGKNSKRQRFDVSHEELLPVVSDNNRKDKT